jgi:hypothetical protein
MLSSADQHLIDRDPRVPGLRVLLDDELFAARLCERDTGVHVQSVHANYVRYKPGTSCLVAYALATDQGPARVYARAHDLEMSAKLEKAAGRMAVPTVLGPGIEVRRDEGIVIYEFPNDHDLDALRELHDDGKRRAVLEAMLPGHGLLREAGISTLSYKPERRFVGRLETTEARAVLKLYTSEDFREASRKHDCVESEGILRTPALVGRSADVNAAALEWLDGQPLHEKILAAPDVDTDAECERAGFALAILHGQRTKLRVECTLDDYLHSMRAAGLAAAGIAPQLAERVERVERRLEERLARRPWRRRTLHGDFSADQVLLDGDHVGIIDFDRASHGDPRIDLGNFAAKLQYDVLRGRLGEDVAARQLSQLLDGYRAASDRDLTGHLWLFTAAALLRLAPEPFRHRLPDWTTTTELIIDAAEEYAHRGAVHHR